MYYENHETSKKTKKIEHIFSRKAKKSINLMTVVMKVTGVKKVNYRRKRGKGKA